MRRRGHAGLAEVDRALARWRVARRQPFDEQRAQGLARAARALEIHPEMPAAMAARDALQALAGAPWLPHPRPVCSQLAPPAHFDDTGPRRWHSAMKRSFRPAVFVSFVVLATGCAAGYGARTSGKGNLEVSASVGGPMFENLGTPMPIPMAHVGGYYGLTEDLDVAVGAHVLAAVYGTLGGDLGARYQLWRRSDDAALAASAQVNVFAGTRDGLRPRVFPEAGIHGQWPLGGRWFALGGIDALAQLDPPRGKPPIFAAPYLGAERRIGARSAIGLTLGWISPWQDSTSVIDYAPATSGAFAVELGYRRLLTGGDR